MKKTPTAIPQSAPLKIIRLPRRPFAVLPVQVNWFIRSTTMFFRSLATTPNFARASLLAPRARPTLSARMDFVSLVHARHNLEHLRKHAKRTLTVPASSAHLVFAKQGKLKLPELVKKTPTANSERAHLKIIRLRRKQFAVLLVQVNWFIRSTMTCSRSLATTPTFVRTSLLAQRVRPILSARVDFVSLARARQSREHLRNHAKRTLTVPASSAHLVFANQGDLEHLRLVKKTPTANSERAHLKIMRLRRKQFAVLPVQVNWFIRSKMMCSRSLAMMPTFVRASLLAHLVQPTLSARVAFVPAARASDALKSRKWTMISDIFHDVSFCSMCFVAFIETALPCLTFERRTSYPSNTQ